MASIKSTVQSILESKLFKDAMETGDTKDLEFLLIQFGYIVFERTQYKAIRTWGKCKRFNELHIRAELKNLEPPLDLFLSCNLSPEPTEHQS